MVTGADIATASRTISSTIDVLKKVKVLADKYGDVEIKEIVVDLRSELADTKSLVIEMKEEINNLKEESGKLKQKLKTTKEISFLNGAYYRKNDVDRKQPFCPTCFETDQILVTMRPFRTSMALDTGNMKCNNCKGFSQVN